MFIHLDVICTLYHIFVCYHVVSLLFLSKQLICSSFYFQDSFSPLLNKYPSYGGPLEQVRIVGLIGLDDVADRQ